MKITRMSPISGRSHTWDIDVTSQQISDWESGTLIQEAMPHLTDDEREFIKTGITPREWAALYPED